MKRKIKFLSLIPLMGIAITAPIIATSCSQTTKTSDEFKNFKSGDKVSVWYWDNTYTGNNSILPSSASGTILNINSIGIELETKIQHIGGTETTHTRFYPFSNIVYIE